MLLQYIINIKIINKLVLLFEYEVFETSCVFHIYSLSQFGPVPFQALRARLWPVVTLDSVDLESGSQTCG